MNDWEINKFLSIILSLQLAIVGLILLDTIGIHIPLLRAFFGFILISFVPGILLLRILRIHKIGNLRTLFFSILLSITFFMLIGLLMNIIYPIIGIKNPISTFYLMLTVTIFVGVLGFLSYILDKNYACPNMIETKKDILSFKSLFLVFIPFIAIIGTYFVKVHHNNIILMILILLISLTVILVTFNKIPKKYYPLTIFLISLSLVFYVTLISNYLTGWDVNGEYYFSNLTKLNSFWNFKIFNDNNAILSINLLAPIYSLILNLNLTWTFKIIYPILYSFVPLALYLVFKSQTNSKIAFLSCMFIVFYSQFFTISSDKQMIGELFLVALIVLIVTPAVSNKKKSILFVIFSASLIVSHYALSYVFLLMLILYFLILFFSRALPEKGFLKLKRKLSESLNDGSQSKINFNYFLLFLILTLAWYMYVSSSSSFVVITKIIVNISGSFVNEFMNPEAAEGYSLLLKSTASQLHLIFKYMFLISEFFITVGLLITLLKDKLRFKSAYLIFSLASFLLLVFSIVVPYFASSLNTSRIYQISLLFLAPFFVVGILVPLNRFFLSIKRSSRDIPLKLISIFLVIFLLFNTGFLFEVFNDNPTSISISQNTVANYGGETNKAFLYQTIYTDQDIESVKWLSKNKNESLKVYSDSWHKLLIINSYGMIPNGIVLHNNSNIPSNSYLYFGSVNIRDGILYDSNKEYYKMNGTNLDMDKSNVIYSNGISKIVLPSNFKFFINNLYTYQTS